MGSGIAVAALGAGYRVIGLDQANEAAEKGRQRIVTLLERNLASGWLDQAGLEAQTARLSVTTQDQDLAPRSEEHTSELQSLMRISYAVFCLKKKKELQFTTYPTQ